MSGTRIYRTTAKISILVGFALLFVLGGSVRGAEVHLAWDANTEDDLAGYVIYYGTESRNYPNSIELDKTTTDCLVTGLTEGQTYYFAAQAFDTSSNYSAFSEELEYQVPASDSDGDGLSDQSEAEIHGTDPQAADTDLDGLGDGAEVLTHHTNPLNADTDSDGLTDGDEVDVHATDPNNPDSDGDGLNDHTEVVVHSTEPLTADTDSDGLDDAAEILTFKTNPLVADSDGDGLRDGREVNTHGTDPAVFDSDQDGLSDGAEVQTHGTDPLDADSDQDGFPDGWEIENGQDPNHFEDNLPPDQPVLNSPTDGYADAELTPTLKTESFSDPNGGDYHRQTRWQVATDPDFSNPVFELTSDRYLTALQLPEALLDTAQTYYWRVRFFDRAQEPSPWSNGCQFTTVTVSSTDLNQNGIPDDQEVDDTCDLDEDRVPDVEQANMKVVRVATGNERIAIKGSANVTAIETLMSIPSGHISERYAKPRAMPYEVISFRCHVAQPGDTATITILFSEPAPEGSKWYKYDLASGWQDFSAHAAFSANRKKLTLELTDGGIGDGDGVVNGVILDPSGLGSEELTAPLEDVFAGCFIGSVSKSTIGNHTLSSAARLGAAAFFIGLVMVMLGLIFQAVRKAARRFRDDIEEPSAETQLAATGEWTPEPF